MFFLLARKRNQGRCQRDDFLSGGPTHQLEWKKSIMSKHFKSKPNMMGAPSDLGKSRVMLSKKIAWQDDGIACNPDKRRCLRVVEALKFAACKKAVVTPAVRESEDIDGESIRGCPRESLRAPESRGEKRR